MKDIKIFVSHRIDKKSIKIPNSLFYDVQCGAYFNDRPSELIGDNTGDNISQKRLSFCELTVFYWAWKNIEADYYGFCHYRRYLSFAERKYEENELGVIQYPQIDQTAINRFRLDEDSMRAEIEKHDIITNVSIPIKGKSGYASVLDYCRDNPQGYKIKDIQILRQVVEEKYPEDITYFDSFFAGNENRWYNCYIMKKNILHEYASWLFDILFELEKRIDISLYTQEQMRVFGVLAERLWGVFLKKVSNKYSICEKQLVFFEETMELPTPIKACTSLTEHNIPIVIPAIEDEFALAWACVRSIMQNKNLESQYHIILLHDCEIDSYFKESLRSLVEREGSSFAEYNTSHLIKKYKRYLQGRSIFDRDLLWFSALEAFVDVKRILLLSPYMLIRSDLTELMKCNLNGMYAAAVPDYRTLCEGYQYKSRKNYFIKTLHQEEPWCYFNFECAVINVSEINLQYPALSFIALANIKAYTSPFQDAMNARLFGHVIEIDSTWCVNADLEDYYHNIFRWYLPYSVYQKYVTSYNHPQIVYFDALFCPWNNLNVDFSHEFWNLVRGTCVYERILSRMIFQCVATLNNNNMQMISIDSRSGIRKLADKVLPKGSKRREFLKVILPKGSLRWRLLKQIYYVICPEYRPVNERNENE